MHRKFWSFLVKNSIFLSISEKMSKKFAMWGNIFSIFIFQSSLRNYSFKLSILLFFIILRIFFRKCWCQVLHFVEPFPKNSWKSSLFPQLGRIFVKNSKKWQNILWWVSVSVKKGLGHVLLVFRVSVIKFRWKFQATNPGWMEVKKRTIVKK